MLLYLFNFAYVCLFFALLAVGYRDSPYYDYQLGSQAIVSIGNFCAWYFTLPVFFLDQLLDISLAWGIGIPPYGVRGYIISGLIWYGSALGYLWYKV